MCDRLIEKVSGVYGTKGDQVIGNYLFQDFGSEIESGDGAVVLMVY